MSYARSKAQERVFRVLVGVVMWLGDAEYISMTTYIRYQLTDVCPYITIFDIAIIGYPMLLIWRFFLPEGPSCLL